MTQNEPETRQVQVGDSHTESIPIIRIPDEDGNGETTSADNPAYD